MHGKRSSCPVFHRAFHAGCFSAVCSRFTTSRTLTGYLEQRVGGAPSHSSTRSSFSRECNTTSPLCKRATRRTTQAQKTPQPCLCQLFARILHPHPTPPRPTAPPHKLSGGALPASPQTASPLAASAPCAARVLLALGPRRKPSASGGGAPSEEGARGRSVRSDGPASPGCAGPHRQKRRAASDPEDHVRAEVVLGALLGIVPGQVGLQLQDMSFPVGHSANGRERTGN